MWMVWLMETSKGGWMWKGGGWMRMGESWRKVSGGGCLNIKEARTSGVADSGLVRVGGQAGHTAKGRRALGLVQAADCGVQWPVMRVCVCVCVCVRYVPLALEGGRGGGDLCN